MAFVAVKINTRTEISVPCSHHLPVFTAEQALSLYFVSDNRIFILLLLWGAQDSIEGSFQ